MLLRFHRNYFGWLKTNVITLKTQKHAVNAGWKPVLQLVFNLLFFCFRDLEAFTKKENAERKRETEDINEALRTENEKRIKEAQALKDKMERENKEMQVRDTLDQTCTTYGPWAKCGPQKLLIWPEKPKCCVFSMFLP